MLTSKINSFHENLLAEFSNARIARGFNRGKGDEAPYLCREYLEFLEGQNCESVTSSHIFHYRKFCEYIRKRKKHRGTGSLSVIHQKHIFYAVHSFYNYLQEAHYMESIPVSGSLFQHPPATDKHVLKRKEVETLFSKAETQVESAILALAYGCGMRRSEIERLDVTDYSPSQSLISVRDGKYFKSRVIPISDKYNHILQSYFNNYRLRISSKATELLVDPEGRPVNGEAAYQIIRRLSRKASIHNKSVGLHILRNSIAVHMIDRGADLEFVKRFLGHTLIDTTTLYATRRRKRISLKRRIYASQKTA
jgi:integrase/recombinase XerD